MSWAFYCGGPHRSSAFPDIGVETTRSNSVDQDNRPYAIMPAMTVPLWLKHSFGEGALLGRGLGLGGGTISARPMRMAPPAD